MLHSYSPPPYFLFVLLCVALILCESIGLLVLEVTTAMFRIMIKVLVAIVVARALYAAEVKLAWDKPAGSKIAGFRVYSGTESRRYGPAVDVGDRTEYTFSLVDPGLYYFAVTSYDGSGFESGFSNEAAWQSDPDSPVPARTFVFPRITQLSNSSGADRLFTGVAMTNTGPNPVSLRFVAYDRRGVPLAGSGIHNPVSIQVQSGSQAPVIDAQIFNLHRDDKEGGWFKVESDDRGVQGLFLAFDSALTMMDGTPAADGPSKYFVLPEIQKAGYTQFHVINPGAKWCDIAFDLIAADGAVRSSSSRTVSPRGTLIENVQGLFPGVPPEPGDYVQGNSSEATSAVEFFGDPGRNFATLAGQDARGAGTLLYSPYYVSGTGLLSALSLVNIDSSPGSADVQLFGDDGNPVGIGRTIPLAGNGKASIDSPAFFSGSQQVPLQGYLRVTTSGIRVVGAVAVRDSSTGASAWSLPLVSQLHNSLIYTQVVSNDTYFNDVYLVNPRATPATIALQAFDSDGILIDSQTDGIPAMGRVRVRVGEYFPALRTRNLNSGYLVIHSDQDIASFALFGTTDSSVVAAMPGQSIR